MSALLAALAAAAAATPPICTDRPAKANATCTVPKGKVQLEAALAGWSATQAGGTRSETFAIGSTVFKLGLTNRSDLQVGVTPVVRLTVKTSGSRERTPGFGDLVVRYKHRLSADDSKVQVAAIPFVKLPTAHRGLGNGKVEGGVALPVSFSLSGPVTMTLGPEVDLLADADGHGRHAAIVNLVNIAGPIAPRLTLAGELWSNVKFDPGETVRQASADLAAAYAVSDSVQLDAGANFGLTRETPDVELYVGTSMRL